MFFSVTQAFNVDMSRPPYKTGAGISVDVSSQRETITQDVIGRNIIINNYLRAAHEAISSMYLFDSILLLSIISSEYYSPG